MKNESQPNPVEEFIIASERNLNVGEAVHLAWPTARANIMALFCEKLEAELRKTLVGWEFSASKRFFMDRNQGFSFGKSSWSWDYFVNLQASGYGEKMIYGVVRNEDQIKGRPFSPELAQAVRQINPNPKTGFWWEAELQMRSPEIDWRTAEVLWRIHTAPAFLNDVAAQLLGVARLVEPIIDKLVETYG